MLQELEEDGAASWKLWCNYNGAVDGWARPAGKRKIKRAGFSALLL